MFDNTGDTPTLTLHWPSLEGYSSADIHQTLKMLDIVQCELTAGKDLMQFNVSLSDTTVFSQINVRYVNLFGNYSQDSPMKYPFSLDSR